MRKKENPDILPYKQRVGGSNPSAPTDQTKKPLLKEWFFVFRQCLQIWLRKALRKTKNNLQIEFCLALSPWTEPSGKTKPAAAGNPSAPTVDWLKVTLRRSVTFCWRLYTTLHKLPDTPVSALRRTAFSRREGAARAEKLPECKVYTYLFVLPVAGGSCQNSDDPNRSPRNNFVFCSVNILSESDKGRSPYPVRWSLNTAP